jgi:hypothetical protein
MVKLISSLAALTEIKIKISCLSVPVNHKRSLLDHSPELQVNARGTLTESGKICCQCFLKGFLHKNKTKTHYGPHDPFDHLWGGGVPFPN